MPREGSSARGFNIRECMNLASWGYEPRPDECEMPVRHYRWEGDLGDVWCACARPWPCPDSVVGFGRDMRRITHGSVRKAVRNDPIEIGKNLELIARGEAVVVDDSPGRWWDAKRRIWRTDRG